MTLDANPRCACHTTFRQAFARVDQRRAASWQLGIASISLAVPRRSKNLRGLRPIRRPPRRIVASSVRTSSVQALVIELSTNLIPSTKLGLRFAQALEGLFEKGLARFSPRRFKALVAARLLLP